jgi:hypothetical protein
MKMSCVQNALPLAHDGKIMTHDLPLKKSMGDGRVRPKADCNYCEFYSIKLVCPEIKNTACVATK